MKINLNDTVIFTPTDYGREICAKQDRGMSWKIGTTLHMMQREDQRFETKLWHLMQLFGQRILMSGKQIILNNELEVVKV
jgi:hypothetical protein